jgi:hypothetical protein
MAKVELKADRDRCCAIAISSTALLVVVSLPQLAGVLVLLVDALAERCPLGEDTSDRFGHTSTVSFGSAPPTSQIPSPALTPIPASKRDFGIRQILCGGERSVLYHDAA